MGGCSCLHLGGAGNRKLNSDAQMAFPLLIRLRNLVHRMTRTIVKGCLPPQLIFLEISLRTCQKFCLVTLVMRVIVMKANLLPNTSLLSNNTQQCTVSVQYSALLSEIWLRQHIWALETLFRNRALT